MMYCGEDSAAKVVVGEVIRQLGWEPLDVGGLDQALHVEHMKLLWVTDTLSNLGTANYQLGRLAEAEAYLIEFTRLDGGNAWARQMLALVRSRLRTQ